MNIPEIRTAAGAETPAQLAERHVIAYEELKAAIIGIETCGLTPCAPCVCSHHAWMGPVQHEAQCLELRAALGISKEEKWDK